MIISNDKLYNRLKFLCQILLPALGTLYFALAGIWGLPSADEVVGTILAVDTFLGIVLGISTSQYNKSELKYDGAIQVSEPDERGGREATMLMDQPLDLSKGEVTFKINSPK